MKVKMAAGFLLGMTTVAFSATRVTSVADFRTGEGTNGWTIGAGEWRSPRWPEGVVVNVCASNLSQGASLRLAEDGGSIVVSRAEGSAELLAVSAEWYVTQLSAPASVSVTNVTATSFRVDWAGVDDAVGYRVDLYTNVVEGASPGTADFAETFNHVPAKGNATALNATDIRAMADGLLDYAVDNLYYGVNLPGVIQIGSTSAPGALGVPLSGALVGQPARTLRFTAWRYENSRVSMPVALVHAGATSEIARVSLAVSPTVFHVALPVLAAGDELLFLSPDLGSGGFRAVLDSFAVLSGYEPGVWVPQLYRQETVDVPGATFEDLVSVANGVSVTALAKDAVDDSEPSACIWVPLDDPPLMPILNACPFSECAREYAPSFAELEQVTKNGTPLYNGVSPLPYWMAYDDAGNVLTTIGKGTASTTGGGAFVFSSANASAAALGRILGLHAKSDSGYFYGLAFENDLPGACGSFTVSYDAVQWSFKNAVPATNRVEWLLTNELVDVSVAGAWRPLAGCEYVAEPTNAVPLAEGADCRTAPCAGSLPDDVKVLPGEFLLLRFAVDPLSYAPGFGWANFRVVWKTAQTGGVLLLR